MSFCWERQRAEGPGGGICRGQAWASPAACPARVLHTCQRMKALLLATNPLQPLIPSLVHTHSLRKHFLDSGVPWGGGHFLPVQVVSTFRQTMGTVCVVNPISSMRSVGLEFCEPFLSTSRRCLRPGEEEDRMRP